MKKTMTLKIANYINFFLLFILGHHAVAQDTLFINQDNSPYYILEDIIIQDGGAFIITEGAEIFIGDQVSIVSNGAVSFQGTPAHPIVIKPITPEVGWNNIDITSRAERVSIKHTTIEDGVLLIHDCEVELQYVNFINHQASPWNRAILRAFGGELNIDNCSILSNNRGEGFLCHDIVSPNITNCVFISKPDAVEMLNCVDGRIGKCEFVNMHDDAIDLNNCNNILIDSNLIVNVADRGMEIGSENFGSSTNIIVYRNVVVDCKEGINFKEGSTGVIENNTIYNNEIGVNVIESKFRMEGSEVMIRNCIFDKNSIPIFTDVSSTATTSYCLSTDVLLAGENNRVGNPYFVNADLLDFNLLEDSDCINAGDPNSAKDPDGSRADIGAYYLSILGSSEMNLSEIMVWPIPTSNFVNIALPENNIYHSFYIIGLMGQEQIIPVSKNAKYHQFDLSSFPSGLYFIVCDSDNGIYKRKIIKM